MDESQTPPTFPSSASKSSPPSEPRPPRRLRPVPEAPPESPEDLAAREALVAARRAFRSPEWEVLRSLLARRRLELVEKLVLSPNESVSIHIRAQVLMLDWMVGGKWEVEETVSGDPAEVPATREYIARDREE